MSPSGITLWISDFGDSSRDYVTVTELKAEVARRASANSGDMA